jgi:multidrug efflux pump subunit AcrA (membrane-fusion protein)
MPRNADQRDHFEWVTADCGVEQSDLSSDRHISLAFLAREGLLPMFMTPAFAIRAAGAVASGRSAGGGIAARRFRDRTARRPAAAPRLADAAAQSAGVAAAAQAPVAQTSTPQTSMTLADERAFDCVMDPSLRANLGSQVLGLLAAMAVRRGDHVHSGQVVARLISEVEPAQVALDQLRASSTAEIEAREAQLTLAQRELGRTEELYKRQVATAQHLDELRAQAAVSDRELSLARQVREATQLELLRSKA